MPNSPLTFPPTPAAARARLAAIRPALYAASRNNLDGAVSQISPYVTHGFISLADAVKTIRKQYALTPKDKLMMEFGWREYFHHVWQHLDEGIFEDRRAAISSALYATTMPLDIVHGATGIPAIDQAVRTLYATGYLHNHARMWLASYVVHLRKVHWRTGADWLYGYLLDGDLASNHLSWQWIAGTFSSKPYLFNAENIARHVTDDAHKAWLSPGTSLDQSYEALEAIARSEDPVAAEPGQHAAVEPPALFDAPANATSTSLEALREKFARRAVELVHPWNLGEHDDAGLKLAVIHTPFHARFPWSALRWDFVMARMQDCDALFIGDLNALKESLAQAQVSTLATRNPGYQVALSALAHELRPEARIWPEVEELEASLSPSFTQFYAKATGTAFGGKATVPSALAQARAEARQFSDKPFNSHKHSRRR